MGSTINNYRRIKGEREREKEIKKIMKDYECNWEEAKSMLDDGLV